MGDYGTQETEDDSIVLKGSAMYEYLYNNGFTNFSTYDKLNQSVSTLHSQEINGSQHFQITSPAPKWTIEHLNCILKSGIILEDHRHFIESYRPVQVIENHSYVRTLMFCSAPLLFIKGFSRTNQSMVPQALLVTAFGVSSLFAIFHMNERIKIRSLSHSLSRLQSTLTSLENVLVQFKRMVLLVHQNESVAQNISRHRSEMFELQKKLRFLLLNSTQKFIQFLDGVCKVPLSFNFDPSLESLSSDCLYDDLEEDAEISCSAEMLKKLFNNYILVQSEFLRRLALCYCPEVWSERTPTAVFSYSQKKLPEVLNWSSDVHKTLIHEHKFFKVITESKDKQNVQKLPAVPGWEFSDVYVSVRSANIHFQSLLIQTQGLQDILESGDCNQTRVNREFLNTVANILTEINKEINFGQVNIDASLTHILKMIDALNPAAKLDHELAALTVEDSDSCLGSAILPPVEDEVFELTVPQEQITASDGEEWDDITISRKKKEKETSKKVLLELKTVLVKKAEEWQEREKRALESKGIAYVPPEQVQPLEKEKNVEENLYSSNPEKSAEFLPTSNQNEWPLPRLKGNVQTHRSHRGSKSDLLKNVSGQLDAETEHFEGGDGELVKEREIPRVGFGATLLAEAMAKSMAMRNSRKEDVFLNSDDENSSGD